MLIAASESIIDDLGKIVVEPPQRASEGLETQKHGRKAQPQKALNSLINSWILNKLPANLRP
jgi:hypothetical protein